LPLPLGFVALPETATDIVLREGDGLALLGLPTQTLLMNVSDPSHPQLAGHIDGVAGRLTLSNSNVVFSTAYGPPEQGGIHTAALGSACAAFRALLRDHPPSQAQIPTDPQLEWTLAGGVTPADGLVLTNVQLGRRQMATKMSLPFIRLTRIDAKKGELLHRCELAPKDGHCTGASPARVNLLKFRNRTVHDSFLDIEAQYLIDQ